MERRTILVTGASGGIGRETALTLARQGHKLIIHGRDGAKTKAVYNEIKAEANSEAPDMFVADLSLLAEVKAFAQQVKAQYGRIDVLLNNAGGQFGARREVTDEGHEKTMAINLLAPFLLTHLLLEPLQNSPSGRVVTVASESYRQGGKPLLEDIELQHNYSLTKAYGLSKLYVYWVMRHFVQEMNKRQISGITFNTVEPGSVDTDLGRVSTQGTLVKLVYFLWKPMMWSVQQGAATSIYMATSEEAEGVTGRFYGNCKQKNIKPKYISPEGEQRVWDYCMQACAPYMEAGQ